MLRFDEFLSALPILLYGIAGVFAVIVIIALAIKLMSWVFPNGLKAE